MKPDSWGYDSGSHGVIFFLIFLWSLGSVSSFTPGNLSNGSIVMPRLCLILDTPASELQPLGEAVTRLGGGEWVVHTLRLAGGVQPFLESHPECGLIIADFFAGDGRHKKTSLMSMLRASAPKVPLIAAAAKGDVKTA